MNTDRTDPGAGRHVLLAVADPTAELVCAAALAELGISVAVVRTGVGAVISARQQLPDLLLVDVQLEDVPGRQAIGWLRGNPGLRDRPVVLLVDGLGDATQVELIRPSAVLHRPLTTPAVRAVVGQLLGAGLAAGSDDE